MNASFKTTAFIALLGLGAAHAQTSPAGEMGRVISTTPVLQQFAVPSQVCGTQQVAIQQPKSGAGSLMGAIAGGAVGNNVGAGSGRAVATMIGVIGGAVMGDNIEGQPAPQVQNIQTCSTQTTYENRTVGYNVVYEYAGRQYNVQMPQAPGPFIQLQVSPVGSAPPVQQHMAPVAQMPQVAAPQQVVYAQQPQVIVAAPYPYPYMYPNVSFGFGFGGGYGRRWR